ncbi:MAG TPA: hypothetical protein VEN28_00045 [Burkholderiaceae bacterium]|nr:hypothetical protein [Burkholderiaceae bacterium]
MNSLIWSAAALALVALLVGTTFGHVLEMPVKMKSDGRRWVSYQQTLYPYFASVGGAIEMAAIVGAALIAWFLRDETDLFYLALAATVMLALAFFVIWIFVTNATNRRTATWSESALPDDWERWRTQWEYSHAARFVLQLLAFLALAYALLAYASG